MILWQQAGIILQYELYLLFAGMLVISALYASVGHGGASGYLALLSLTSYGTMSHIWLKQHVWVMNMVVASIAFYHYHKAGYHKIGLTAPFILTSIPMAFIGGMLEIKPDIYDILLSITLIWAAYKILNYSDSNAMILNTPSKFEAYIWGGGIGFFSGIIGVGGGIFLSPILLLKRWADVKTAAATAAVFIFFNSLSGLIGMGISDQLGFDQSILILMVSAILIGGFVGALFGATYAKKTVVRKILAVVLIIAVMKRVVQFLLF